MKKIIAVFLLVLSVSAFPESINKELWGKSRAEIVALFGDDFQVVDHESIQYRIELLGKARNTAFIFSPVLGLSAVAIKVSADEVKVLSDAFTNSCGKPMEYGPVLLWMTGPDEVSMLSMTDDGKFVCMFATKSIVALAMMVE